MSIPRARHLFLLAQGQDPIDQVVSSGDPGKYRIGNLTHDSMTSKPV